MSIKTKSRTLPETEYLFECFEYCPRTGTMRWKHRPKAHFKSLRAFNIWNATFAGKPAGSRTGVYGHMQVGINGVSYFVHRVVWKMMTGTDPKYDIDHINRECTDNRWANLRDVNKVTNSRNQRRRPNSNKVSGINKSGASWFVTIGVGGSTENLGRTPDYFEAVCLRKSAEIRYGYSVDHMRELTKQ